MTTPPQLPACLPSPAPLDTTAASRAPSGPEQATRDAANNMVSEGNASSTVLHAVSMIDTQVMAESRKRDEMRPPAVA